MAEGLDGRHWDKNGRISEKQGNTKMKNLKPVYPELKNFGNEDTLSTVKERQGVDTLDELLKKARKP
jgi:hypothetical protein